MSTLPPLVKALNAPESRTSGTAFGTRAKSYCS